MALTAEQYEIRRTMITASDTYVLAGEGYADQSPLLVWKEKVHGVEMTPKTVVQRMGDALEPLALDLLVEDRGLRLEACSTLRSELFPWLGATPDRIVLDSSGSRVAVAEAKAVTNPTQAAKWAAGPPPRVIIQTTIQMLVTRTRRAYVPVLLLGDYRCFEVELDDENLGPALLELDEEFWTEHVEARVPPDPDDTEASAAALRQLYPRVRGGMLRASPEVEEIARAYFEATRAFDEAKAKRTAAMNQLQATIGDHAGLEGDGWRAIWAERRGQISWKTACATLLKGRTTPEVFEQFRGEPTRAFSCEPVTDDKGTR